MFLIRQLSLLIWFISARGWLESRQNWLPVVNANANLPLGVLTPLPVLVNRPRKMRLHNWNWKVNNRAPSPLIWNNHTQKPQKKKPWFGQPHGGKNAPNQTLDNYHSNVCASRPHLHMDSKTYANIQPSRSYVYSTNPMASGNFSLDVPSLPILQSTDSQKRLFKMLMGGVSAFVPSIALLISDSPTQ